MAFQKPKPVSIQEIYQAAVRVDGNVRVVVEIFPVGEPVVGLKDVQGSGCLELMPELFERDRQLSLRQMLEKVAGEDEIHARVLDGAEFCRAGHYAFPIVL